MPCLSYLCVTFVYRPPLNVVAALYAEKRWQMAQMAIILHIWVKESRENGRQGPRSVGVIS